MCDPVHCSASPWITWGSLVTQRYTFCVLQCVLRCVLRCVAVCHLGRPDFCLSRNCTSFVCCSVVALCCIVLHCSCCGELQYTTLEDLRLACDSKVHLLLVTVLLQSVAVCLLPCSAMHHRARHDVGLSPISTPLYETDCFYCIIVQTYDVGLHCRRHPMDFDAGTRPFASFDAPSSWSRRRRERRVCVCVCVFTCVICNI